LRSYDLVKHIGQQIDNIGVFRMKIEKLAFILIMISPFIAVQSQAAENLLNRAAGLLTGRSTDNTELQASSGEIGSAFKQALSIASETVVNNLGSPDGFNTDPAIHIPLPDQLDRVKTMLSSVGMAGMVEDLELKLNRAAEAATPVAKELFLQSISELNFADVMAIYQGPNDSATRYFQNTMSESLAAQMLPIVQSSLSEVGALQAFQQVMDRYDSIPFARSVNTDLSPYVVEKGMDGIFHYIAQEEAAIRENPLKQTTDLLRRVFQ